MPGPGDTVGSAPEGGRRDVEPRVQSPEPVSSAPAESRKDVQGELTEAVLKGDLEKVTRIIEKFTSTSEYKKLLETAAFGKLTFIPEITDTEDSHRISLVAKKEGKDFGSGFLAIEKTDGKWYLKFEMRIDGIPIPLSTTEEIPEPPKEQLDALRLATKQFSQTFKEDLDKAVAAAPAEAPIKTPEQAETGSGSSLLKVPTLLNKGAKELIGEWDVNAIPPEKKPVLELAARLGLSFNLNLSDDGNTLDLTIYQNEGLEMQRQEKIQVTDGKIDQSFLIGQIVNYIQFVIYKFKENPDNKYTDLMLTVEQWIKENPDFAGLGSIFLGIISIWSKFGGSEIFSGGFMAEAAEKKEEFTEEEQDNILNSNDDYTDAVDSIDNYWHIGRRKASAKYVAKELWDINTIEEPRSLASKLLLWEGQTETGETYPMYEQISKDDVGTAEEGTIVFFYLKQDLEEAAQISEEEESPKTLLTGIVTTVDGVKKIRCLDTSMLEVDDENDSVGKKREEAIQNYSFGEIVFEAGFTPSEGLKTKEEDASKTDKEELVRIGKEIEKITKTKDEEITISNVERGELEIAKFEERFGQDLSLGDRIILNDLITQLKLKRCVALMKDIESIEKDLSEVKIVATEAKDEVDNAGRELQSAKTQTEKDDLEKKLEGLKEKRATAGAKITEISERISAKKEQLSISLSVVLNLFIKKFDSWEKTIDQDIATNLAKKVRDLFISYGNIVNSQTRENFEELRKIFKRYGIDEFYSEGKV